MTVKVRVNCNNGVWLDVDAANPKDAFRDLAVFQEVFGEVACGKCSGTQLQYVCRTIEGNDYYQLRCRACSSTLDFGQTKEGNRLFPKRKDSDGNWDNVNGGWYKWKDRESSQNKEF